MFYLRQPETDLFNQQLSCGAKLVINYLVSGDKDMKQSDIIPLSQLCASFLFTTSSLGQTEENWNR